MNELMLQLGFKPEIPCAFSYACVYLACKVEEFNIPIEMFIKNMPSVRNALPGTAKHEAEKAGDLLLSQELPLLEILHFHLTVHNPYRPVEGLIIDIKVGA